MVAADIEGTQLRRTAINLRPQKLRASQAFLILGTHIILGIASAVNSKFATVAAFAVTAIVLVIAMWSPSPARVIAVTVYGGVSDVLWRITGAQAPWEMSKYIVAGGALAFVIRFVRSRSGMRLSILIVCCLIPGIATSAFAEGIGIARDRASGYEMGLISFAIAACAFRHIIADQSEAWRLIFIALGPLTAALSAVSYSLVTSPTISFTDESNFGAAGGFGPNQVSSGIGLIILLCTLLGFLPSARRYWPVLAGLSLWSMWTTFLTFSRGGVYSALLAGAAMMLVGIGSRGARIRAILLTAVALIAIVVAFTSANDFSGNWLDTRYRDSSTTGRVDIAELDLEVFGAHPLMGVGTGRAPEFRRHTDFGGANAHTEFTRLLAEHGLFGLGVLILLGVMLVQAYRRSLSYWNRLMIVALSVWSLTTMLHAATRISAVGLMLALTQVRVEPASAGTSRAL